MRSAREIGLRFDMPLHMRAGAVLCAVFLAVAMLPASAVAAALASGPDPFPAPTPIPAASPAPTPFTLGWFPDTQTSAVYEPEALSAMGKWVVDHAESDDVVYVLQTGDLVDNGYEEWQWKNFELAYDQFRDTVPYFAIAGNHDLGIKRQEWDGYLARPYAHTVPESQQYAGGKAAYTLFTAGGIDFLVIGVGYGAEEECAHWIRGVAKRYPDCYGILLAHDFLHGRGDYVDALGECVHYRILGKCKNIYMCLCGHFRGTAYRTYEYDDTYDGAPDRVVHTLLCNYQHFAVNGGQLHTLRFDPATGDVTVDTFSALTGQAMRDRTFKKSEFTLPGILYSHAPAAKEEAS